MSMVNQNEAGIHQNNQRHLDLMNQTICSSKGSKKYLLKTIVKKKFITWYLFVDNLTLSCSWSFCWAKNKTTAGKNMETSANITRYERKIF